MGGLVVEFEAEVLSEVGFDLSRSRVEEAYVGRICETRGAHGGAHGGLITGSLTH